MCLTVPMATSVYLLVLLVRGSDTERVILTDKSLGQLMDRLEDKYGDQD
jgi:hypothetical protein